MEAKRRDTFCGCPMDARIYFRGDTNVFSDMALIRELYAPQLAMLPNRRPLHDESEGSGRGLQAAPHRTCYSYALWDVSSASLGVRISYRSCYPICRELLCGRLNRASRSTGKRSRVIVSYLSLTTRDEAGYDP